MLNTVFALIFDETSMISRLQMGLSEHHCRTIIQKENPWGYINIRMMFGDTHQLPPVAAKAFSDTEEGIQKESADNYGNMVMDDFFNTKEKLSEHVVIVMDKDIRQKDEESR